MSRVVSRIVLGAAGAMAVGIGGAILAVPHAFFAVNGVALSDDPNLMSEIRAPGGLLFAAGAVMLAGALKQFATRLALMTAMVVYGAYGLSRLIGVALDGAPSTSLLAAIAIELFISALAAFLLTRSGVALNDGGQHAA